MKDYIRSIEIKGAIKEVIGIIENIVINDNPFVIDATPLEDLHEPEKMSTVKVPRGKIIITLAQDIVDIVTDFYKEKDK